MDILHNTLLIERNDLSLTESLVDNQAREKKYIIKGIFLQSDIKNRNGRIYPEKVMDTAVRRYIDEYLSKNRSVGELNHPVGDGSGSVNYERATHLITSLVKDGKNYIGEAVIAHKTPLGATVAGLMDIGVQMGVSSRATGSLKMDIGGAKIVQDDFHIITAGDIVSDPSAPDAFVTSIMEGHEWVFKNGILTEQAIDESRLIIENTAKKSILDEQRLINVFQYILANKVGK